MVEDASEVEKYFVKRHIKLKRSWLLEALNFVSAWNRLADLVYHQWLFADIKVSTEPIYGLRKMVDARTFQEPYIFQIHAISDIGTPNLRQFKRLTDPLYEEPKEFDQPNFNQVGGRSCFSLQLSDGVVELKAFEKRRVPDLSISTCPGSKILIYGNVELCHGYIFLSADNCQFLGGAVEHLMHVNNVLKTLSELLNKPIPKTTKENELTEQSRKKKAETTPPKTPPQQKKRRQSEEAAISAENVPPNGSRVSRTYDTKTVSGSTFAPEISPSAPTERDRTELIARQMAKSLPQATASTSFVPEVPASTPEEDDAELFGRRVVKFLRGLSSARRRRQACIGFEHVMIQFEEEEEGKT